MEFNTHKIIEVVEEKQNTTIKKKSNLFFRCSVRGGEVGIIDVICDCNWVRSGHQNSRETDNFHLINKIDK